MVTQPVGVGLTQGGVPGGGVSQSSLSCASYGGGGSLGSRPSRLPLRCDHQTGSVWKQALHWLRANGQLAVAFLPAPSWPGAQSHPRPWLAGLGSRLRAPRNMQLQDQQPGSTPAQQSRRAGGARMASAPGQGVGGAGPVSVRAVPRRPAPMGPSGLAVIHGSSAPPETPASLGREAGCFTDRPLMSECPAATQLLS